MLSLFREIRRAYPTIESSLFISIFETNQDADNLLDLLAVAEAEALVKKEGEDRAFAEVEKRLRMNELHVKLHFVVPADVDLVHAQSIIMYGFINPGSSSPYVGRHVLAEANLMQNVANKLGRRFSRAKYDLALDYLGKQGVVWAECEGGLAYSLNPNHGRGHGASPQGAQIIKLALAYLRHK
jgi:hypothetical protein